MLTNITSLIAARELFHIIYIYIYKYNFIFIIYSRNISLRDRNELKGSKRFPMETKINSGTHDIEVEVLGDPVAALLEFVVKAHDVQGVETIDDGRAHVRGAENAGAVASFRDRS